MCWENWSGASATPHRVEGVIHPDAELVELVWVELGSKPLADLHPMTKNVLGELERRLATGPLRHDAEVPFYHFYAGKMHRDKLGEGRGAELPAILRHSGQREPGPYRHCERSEAIHAATRGNMDCFVAGAPRNDEIEMSRANRSDRRRSTIGKQLDAGNE